MPPHESVAARLGRLALDLAVDHAWSLGQVQRRYGLSEASLRTARLPLVTAYLAPSHGSYMYRRVEFVTHTKKQSRLDPNALRHLAGTAELRFVLHAHRRAWRSTTTPHHPRLPDALWQAPTGKIAIEYDVGSYSRQQILTKATQYLAFDGQIWGSPSRARVRHLQVLLEQADPGADARYAPWL